MKEITHFFLTCLSIFNPKTFCFKMQNQLNRRDFIRQSSFAALGLAFTPTFLKKVAPSDRLRVAHIGINGMGTQHLKWFSALPGLKL